jgi:sugar O-acyltransferase (sialic acid O-acetyltransferase NeuD family)
MPVIRQEWKDKGAELVFIDDGAAASNINGHPVWTWTDFLMLPHESRNICLAIADPGGRRRLFEKCADAGISVIGTKSANTVLMDDVEIGEGACLSPYVTITSNIRIGRCFHANLYAYVEHDCVLGDFVTFAPGAKCNGNVRIGNGVYVGSGAVIKQGTKDAPLVIGEGAVIGMGAVVTKNVPANTIVVGNPARRIQGSLNA